MVIIFCPVSEEMPEKGYSQRTKIRDKGPFPKVPDCHGYNCYIRVDPPGKLRITEVWLQQRSVKNCQETYNLQIPVPETVPCKFKGRARSCE